ncbi:MAG: glycosyl hydrolase 53 family protein [Saprospiraceae bacterium]|nr:glycosyl hydrolase 53 family protein [Saprospiraceae bacterium]
MPWPANYDLLKLWSFILSGLVLLSIESVAQEFYFGADQSYVNEMEDCGADYKEDGQTKDVYEIFQEHGGNLVRLRLWHTPSWYDQLNAGKRYSDLTDVTKSISRAKDHGMKVLLDFHLSDNWADPSKQLVPSAWLGVVDDLPMLKDSLYKYIYSTLMTLYHQDLLPDMVQIGNETNRGILLSPEDNRTYTLDWTRNTALFNEGIHAVRAVTAETGQDVDIALHVAGPADIEWFIDQFVSHGVTDFDIIAMSYYWAWHKPTTIPQTGEVIRRLKSKYPDKQVMIVETGYLWTTANADAAPNIINEQNPDYLPASPENQKRWLIDLTAEVIKEGGSVVIYWEPSGVSTPCYNQWNQGSHQDHATFFDFDDNLLIPGGIQWMEHAYGLTTTALDLAQEEARIRIDGSKITIELTVPFNVDRYILADSSGRIVDRGMIDQAITEIQFSQLSSGTYFISLTKGANVVVTGKLVSTH